MIEAESSPTNKQNFLADKVAPGAMPSLTAHGV
jgi:hypothetical protein